MPVYQDFTFAEWFFPGREHYGFLVTLLLFIPFLGLCGAFAWCLVAAVRKGPVDGFYAVAGAIRDGVIDVSQISARRTLAITRLAIQEAVRRRVLVVIAVFLCVLLFAGWFLDVKTDHPARLYLSFVLTATSYLVLMLALFLSAFSLPDDVKSRTIYTVVTKPVRPVEIVAGRILGFTAIGTVLLAAMCLLSYCFVVGGLRHKHEVEADRIVENPPAAPGGSPTWRASTTYDAHHRHEATIGPDGVGRSDEQRGHTHLVRRIGQGRAARCEVGPAQGMLEARVPLRGKLRFLDRQGAPVDKGVSVGNEWTYRSYIEGDTLHTAIWTFEGISPRRFPVDRFPNGLPLEMTIRVFRTYKGRIEKGVMGEIRLCNPNRAKPLLSTEIPFESVEFGTKQISIPWKLSASQKDGSLRTVDLFQDFVSDGKVELWLRCIDRNQYFGVAQADVYFRAADAPFFVNFVKGYASIWLQMLVVTCLGVMFSTFLSGAVAMLATLTAVVMGYFSQFVVAVQTGEIAGGGPVASLIRLLRQLGVMGDLDIGLAQKPVEAIDFVYMLMVRGASSLLPDFANFNTASYVAYGYNIHDGLLASHTVLALTYAAAAAVIGFFFLKTREIAA